MAEEGGSALGLDEIIKIFLLIPWRAILMAMFYFVSLLIFNVSFVKALVIACVVFISLIARFADRLLGRIGIIVFAYALAYWIDAVPSPAALRDSFASGMHEAFTAVQSGRQ